MSLDRRAFLNSCGRLGFASTLLPGVLFTLATRADERADGKPQRITDVMIAQPALISGVPIAPEQQPSMLSLLNANRKGFHNLRAHQMPDSASPAFGIHPLPPCQP